MDSFITEFFGKVYKNWWNKIISDKFIGGEVMICPKCIGEINMKNRTLCGIEIDLCPVCKGVWLDSGELAALSGIDPAKQDPFWGIEIAIKQLKKYVASRKV